MKYEIRKAIQSDFSSVYKLITQLVEATPHEKQLKEIYNTNLTIENKEHYIAVINHIVLGFISLSYHYSLSEVGKVAVINELVVDSRNRDMGVGTSLVNHALTKANANGCILVEVSTNLLRRETHKFYEKNGFIKNGYRFGYDYMLGDRSD